MVGLGGKNEAGTDNATVWSYMRNNLKSQLKWKCECEVFLTPVGAGLQLGVRKKVFLCSQLPHNHPLGIFLQCLLKCLELGTVGDRILSSMDLGSYLVCQFF